MGTEMGVVAGQVSVWDGIEARGLRKARGGVGFGPTAATGGRRAVERPAGLPTGGARGRAWRR